MTERICVSNGESTISIATHKFDVPDILPDGIRSLTPFQQTDIQMKRISLETKQPFLNLLGTIDHLSLPQHQIYIEANLWPQGPYRELIYFETNEQAVNYRYALNHITTGFHTHIHDYQSDRISKETRDEYIADVWMPAVYRFINDFGACRLPNMYRILLNERESALGMRLTEFPDRPKIKFCAFCDRIDTPATPIRKRCSRCKRVSYCTKQCQNNDWSFPHRLYCQPITNGNNNA